MQNDSTAQQVIDPYDINVPDEPKFCKTRSEETNMCPQDYYLNALSNYFLDRVVTLLTMQ